MEVLQADGGKTHYVYNRQKKSSQNCFVGYQRKNKNHVFIGDYAVCVNAATLALIDAGIPIRDVCCAVSCGLVTKNGEAQTLVDLGK